MKPIIKLLFVGLFILSLSSCAKQKLTNTWLLEQFIENGDDKTIAFLQQKEYYKLVFQDDGTIIFQSKHNGQEVESTARWKFAHKNTKIIITHSNGITDTWFVKSLSSRELNVETISTNWQGVEYNREYFYTCID